jgi:hypothetical protein
MRYLRMLTNAALGGAFGAAFVAVIFLQLNPELPLVPSVVVPLYAVIFLFYGAHIAVAFYVLLVARELFAREALSPGWLSLRLLAWESAFVAAGATLLMWFNLQGFRLEMDTETVRGLTAGTAATAVCTVLLFIIAVVHYSVGRRATRAGAMLLVLAGAASLALPVAARGLGRAPVGEPRRTAVPRIEADTSGARVVVVLFDGASLEYIAPATAQGRLPNFGRLLDQGASMHLTTLRPTQPAAVWAAAFTGKAPQRNGIRSAATYAFGSDPHRITLLPDMLFSYALVYFGVLDEHPHTSKDLRASILWQVLGRVGITVGVVGLPLTDPVEPLPGFMVSDRATSAGSVRLALEGQDLAYPPRLFERVPLPPDRPVPGSDGPELGGVPPDPLLSGRPGPTARDAWFAALAERLEAEYAPRVTLLRLTGIDLAGHYYLRYAMPREFGDVSEADQRRFGEVLDQQYAAADAEIGRVLASLAPGDVLLVVSGFGMQPVTLGKRLLAQVLQQPALTGSHERAPEGFLLAYGSQVASGKFPLGSVTDVAPTVLYLLGLPVGRDMDGYARTDILRPEYSAGRPITFIASYD